MKQEMYFRDEDITEYKTSRGIPIKLVPELYHLYSFNDDVSFLELQEYKEAHDLWMAQQVNSK